MERIIASIFFSFLSSIASGTRLAIEESPGTIRKLNDILERLADGEGDMSKLGREFKSLVPQSGHPNGFYMANVILDNLGKAELVRDINDAPAFFRRYSEAAKKSGTAPVFSEKALKYLDRYRQL